VHALCHSKTPRAAAAVMGKEMSVQLQLRTCFCLVACVAAATAAAAAH
jgi:hypothetical protein